MLQTVKPFLLACFFLAFIPSVFSQKEIIVRLVSLNNDTISYPLAPEVKKKKSISTYQFVKVNTDQGEKIFYPDDLNGYLMKDVFYKSFTVRLDNDSIANFFIKQITVGKVELYYYPGGEGYPSPTYLFKRKNEFKFTAFTKERQIESMEDPYAPRRYSGIMDFGNDQAFLDFFVNYFRDCPFLARKLKTEFYSRADAELFFKEYNECK